MEYETSSWSDFLQEAATTVLAYHLTAKVAESNTDATTAVRNGAAVQDGQPAQPAAAVSSMNMMLIGAAALVVVLMLARR